MARLSFYFFLLVSLGVIAFDDYQEPDIQIAPENIAKPIFLASPFNLVLTSDLKRPGDFGFCGNHIQTRETSMVLTFSHQGDDYSFFPKGSNIKISFDKRQFEQIFSVIKAAQRAQKLLQIESQHLAENGDMYYFPKDQPLPLTISDIDFSPFKEKNNAFSCTRSAIYPVNACFLDAPLGYMVGGHFLDVHKMSFLWKKKLKKILELPQSQGIKVYRYIDDPAIFGLVDPDLVFINTGETFVELDDL